MTITTLRRVTAAALALAAGLACAQQAVPLPPPQTDQGRPLMQALRERKSSREFAPGALPPQVLSNLLWAAYGVNRPASGGRTAPSARDRQAIDVYLTTAEGLYRYDAKTHTLQPLLGRDIRALTGTQDYVKTAPVNLVYVADFSRMESEMSETDKKIAASADAGFIGQNVYLYCASERLATVVRGSIDEAALAKAMGLKPQQRIVLSQSVGYPKP
ncbi:hypothetical protein MoryE10_22280 [Methylogaea oryzae]|uniref:Nitroreductase domain-containing protein n=2 Tax=Methylogaea oryzae TaxID=1295382 RepID=A0A8D4VS81_9GAMM|nr:hypothetical protein MoryE10_22280 [Methylogaea oryzae]